jgi:hypothetical protein
MDFFNSLSIRIPLAIIGGILYGLLTHTMVIYLIPSYPIAIVGGIFVSLFYLSSRFLLLFSGINTPYYFKVKKGLSQRFNETTSFYQNAQWVGKFYHYHDIVLFIFLVIISIAFLVTLVLDGIGNQPLGKTIQDLWDDFTS